MMYNGTDRSIYVSPNPRFVPVAAGGVLGAAALGLLLALAALSMLPVEAAAYPGPQNASRLEIAAYPGPAPVPVIVDDAVYIIPAGGKVLVPAAPGPHRVSLAKTVIYTGQGSRLVFQGWSNGEANSTVVVEAPSALVALFGREYYVEVDAGEGGRGLAGWYPEGSVVSFSVEPVVETGPGSRLVFRGWGGGVTQASPLGRLYVLGPTRVEAHWERQYLVGLEGPWAGYAVGAGWYPEGATVVLQAQPVVAVSDSKRLVFSHWRLASGGLVLSDPSSPIVRARLTGPVAVEPVYRPEYLVRVKSPLGNVTGAGWYPVGSRAAIAVKSSILGAGRGARYVFAAWRVNGTVVSNKPVLEITVEGPLEAAADWRLEYQLEVKTAQPLVKGAGWYPEGATVVLEAQPRSEDRLGIATVFKAWQGDIVSTSPRVTLKMDSPKTVTAVWERSYTGLYLRLAAASAGLAAIYAMYRLLPARLARRQGDGE